MRLNVHVCGRLLKTHSNSFLHDLLEQLQGQIKDIHFAVFETGTNRKSG
jgi:hypothetical protein